MALSVAVDRKGVWGDRKAYDCTITLSGTYSTGGETLNVAAVAAGLNTVIDDVIVHGPAKNAAGTLAYPAQWDKTNAKLQVYTSNGAAGAAAGLAEHPAAGYTASLTVRATVIGY